MMEGRCGRGHGSVGLNEPILIRRSRTPLPGDLGLCVSDPASVSLACTLERRTRFNVTNRF
jgi:hypothetical protein